jgi:hypothetical protein
MFKFLFKSTTKAVCGILLGMILLSSTHAVVSQDPLLTKSSPVQPNLVLMFDDSASMPAQFVYQYGGSEGVFGRTGPGNNNSATCGSTLSITTTCAYTTPGSTDYYEMSSNINGLYYNPQVRYRTRVDASGTFVAAPSATTTTFTVYFYKNGAGANVDWPGTSPGVSATFPTPTLVTSYFGTTTYIPSAALLATSATLGLPYPTVVSPTGTRTFPKFINRTDCNGGATGGSCSLLEERQNYSNWRKYHSNRLDLAKTGLGYAFKDIVATIRLGWGVINTLDGGNLDSGVSVFDPTRKSDFYTWLYARTGAIGGTPNRLALQSVGNYYARADDKGP